MNAFLSASEWINWHHPDIKKKAAELKGDLSSDSEVTKRCFEFVRDQIKHSSDFQLNPVTCKASDVLREQTGYCYAKSHLLAALLRANGIPAGLCYQRLTITDKPPFCLHGLNAVYLQEYGWYRVDARGNKPGVNAEFTPPIESLAFPIQGDGEADLPEIWPEPLADVIQCLTQYSRWDQALANLPDITLVSLPVARSPSVQAGVPECSGASPMASVMERLNRHFTLTKTTLFNAALVLICVLVILNGQSRAVLKTLYQSVTGVTYEDYEPVSDRLAPHFKIIHYKLQDMGIDSNVVNITVAKLAEQDYKYRITLVDRTLDYHIYWNGQHWRSEHLNQ